MCRTSRLALWLCLGLVQAGAASAQSNDRAAYRLSMLYERLRPQGQVLYQSLGGDSLNFFLFSVVDLSKPPFSGDVHLASFGETRLEITGEGAAVFRNGGNLVYGAGWTFVRVGQHPMLDKVKAVLAAAANALQNSYVTYARLHIEKDGEHVTSLLCDWSGRLVVACSSGNATRSVTGYGRGARDLEALNLSAVASLVRSAPEASLKFRCAIGDRGCWVFGVSSSGVEWIGGVPAGPLSLLAGAGGSLWWKPNVAVPLPPLGDGLLRRISYFPERASGDRDPVVNLLLTR